MIIAHISDIHIRNLRYHDEYKKSFDDLYAKLAALKPDLIVNTGDTAHTKVQISPEFVRVASDFFTNLGNIAPVLVILGNHDLNLKNEDRLDAISPIISNVRAKHKVMLALENGWARNLICSDLSARFWLYAIDEDNHSNVFTADKSDDQIIDIGLFHGSVFGAVVDSGFELESYEAKMDRFAGMDFVLMGDIHKRQSFLGGRAWYAGSLIQQNFGEEPDKGFLIWDIRSRYDFDVSFHRVEGSRGFYTVPIGSDLKIGEIDIPPDARLRAIVDAELTLLQQKDIERELRKRFQPKDVVSIVSRPKQVAKVASTDDFDPDESYTDRLEEFIRANGADDKTVETVKQIDLECTRRIQDEDSFHPHAFWRVNKIAWSNLFNYGDGNIIDIDKVRGLVGIFAPNTSGKSSIFDIFLESLFDKITKEAPKNIDLINDNRDLATMVVDMTVGDDQYVIERQIERVKYGQRKFSEAKEWGKTSLSVFKMTPDGRVELSENGISRPETEKQIRRLIGSFDEFVMTSMIAQGPIYGVPGGADIINCKETDRKKILFKFLGLDSFEERSEIAKETLRQLYAELRTLDSKTIEEESAKILEELSSLSEKQSLDQAELLLSRSKLTETTSALASAELAEVPEVPEDPEKIRERRAKIIRERDGLLRSQSEDEISLKNTSEELVKLNGSEPNCPPVQIDKLSKRKDALSASKARLKEQVKTKLSVLKNAEIASETIKEVPCEGKFPSCKFLTDAFEARDRIDDLKRDYEDTVAVQKRFNEELVEVSDLLIIGEKHLQWQKQIAARESEIASISGRIDLTDHLIKAKQEELERSSRDLEDSLLASERRAAVEEMKSGIRKLRSDVTLQRKAVTTLEESVSSSDRKVGALEQRMIDMADDQERLESLQARCSAYELYMGAMGKHGLPYLILTGMLPLINEEINKILSTVVNFSVYIEHDPYEQTMRIYLQYGEYKSRPLGLCSGAEKFIASLAIRAALISVSRLPKTNVMIVDEGFGRLDPEMLDSVQSMLEHMKTIFDSVFVISHVDVMKDWVDTNVDITIDKDGYAHVEVT